MAKKELSLHDVHTRLRWLEIITFISLVLNMALWFFAGKIYTKADTAQKMEAQQ